MTLIGKVHWRREPGDVEVHSVQKIQCEKAFSFFLHITPVLFGICFYLIRNLASLGQEERRDGVLPFRIASTYAPKFSADGEPP